MNKFFNTITKPTILLDEMKARRNIQTMAAKAQASSVLFRPHFKTHQSAEIGTWFWDEGARQITVSSVDMAANFANAGWKDITLAFPLNIRQLQEINELASRIDLGVQVENIEAIHALASMGSKVKVWFKIESGLRRTGIPFDQPNLLHNLLDEARKHSNLNIEGLLTHAGQTYVAHSSAEVLSIHRTSTKRLVELRRSVSGFGLKISVGDTPGCSLSPDFPDVDEIRPGNFIFYDAEQFQIGSCMSDQIAVALACPVVSQHPERNEVVLYGGAIHFSKESFPYQGNLSYGLAVGSNDSSWGNFLPGCSISRLTQEHGILSVPQQYAHLYPVGSLALVVPAHSCLTAHLMRRYLTLDGRTIEMMPV
jgi:D-serine deaminase-like pyridoxal phosphate-dependent protein